jgi:hypothetical protein
MLVASDVEMTDAAREGYRTEDGRKGVAVDGGLDSGSAEDQAR